MERTPPRYSHRSMPSQSFRACIAALLGACSLSVASAQALRQTAGELDHPRVEVYAGYSYWHPFDADINYRYYEDAKWGAEGSVTYFVKPWLGVIVQGSSHLQETLGITTPQYTADAGLQFQTNVRKFVPFAHVLGGGVLLGGPVLNQQKWGYNGVVGVGMDWVPMYRHQWLGVRLFQGDAQYNHVDYGPLIVPAGISGGLAKNYTLSASTGLVFRFGGHPTVHMEPQMSCSADRVEVNEGEPVTISGQVLGFDAMRTMQYSWNTTGGRIVGPGGDTIHIETAGLPVGDYRVMGTAAQGRRLAQCSANFTVHRPEPPTVTCVANPSSIAPGGSATVTATGISPTNRPLVYAFSSSNGRISTMGNTATVRTSSDAVLNGSANTQRDITVICTVQDDHALAGSTTVTIPVTQREVLRTNPDLPPLPLQNDMCSVSFARDPRRPARVDNEGKACLDGIALTMQRQLDSSLVVLADHDRRESAAVAAERAVNVKMYLTQEKGIDSARIQLRSTDGGARQVQNIYLPVGATFSTEGSAIDETAVVHHGEAYGVRGRTSRTYNTRRRTTRRRRARSTGSMTGTSTPPQQ